MPRFILVVLLSIGIAVPASAQSRERGPDQVPPGHRPPPGMCRIWIDGVPPGRQPEPTDCPTAIRRRPANARVIFGDESPKPKPKGFKPQDDKKDPKSDERRRKPDDSGGSGLRRRLPNIGVPPG